MRKMEDIILKNNDVLEELLRISDDFFDMAVIDPPYQNTTGYKETFNIEKVIEKILHYDFPVYISEGYKMDSAHKTYLLSKGRAKGNISGEVKKKPVEEWLNRF